MDTRMVMSCLYLGCLHWLFIMTLFVAADYTSEQALNDSRASGLLDNLLTRMDERIRPRIGGPPLDVQCGFYVISFGSISEIDMDYSMDIYLRQHWMDPRLSYNSSDPESGPIVLSAKTINKIWTPDIFFPNEKEASLHYVTQPNKLMRVYTNGTIVYSVRITLRLSCPMVLTHFPMDRQACEFKMESYSYETKDLILRWFEEKAVEISEDLELPQFDLVGQEISSCHKRYTTGDFPCLQAKFYLKRQFGFYLLQTYIPSVLIVILSWVSFWINMDAVPARISLGVTTVLTMTTQLSGAKASIPKVSYPKAIDVWMSVCMLFVFGSLLEYAFVNVLARKGDTVNPKKVDDINGADDRKGMLTMTEEPPKEGFRFPFKNRRWSSREGAVLIDKCARILFPGVFAVFNIVYWTVYLK